MTSEVTGASERQEDRGAVGSPVERPVRPGFLASFIDGLGLGPIWRRMATCRLKYREDQLVAEVDAAILHMGALAKENDRLRALTCKCVENSADAGRYRRLAGNGLEALMKELAEMDANSVMPNGDECPVHVAMWAAGWVKRLEA